MVALKRGEKTVLRFWISKFWAFVYQTFPKDLKAWYYYHKPNIWGKEMKSQCFSLYIKWSFYSERREVKEKVVGREAQSLETSGVSEKGLCSALPTPGLEEMPTISRIWEQRALWSCISGESQKPLAHHNAEAVEERSQCECSGDQRVPLCSCHPNASLKEPPSFYRPRSLRTLNLTG